MSVSTTGFLFTINGIFSATANTLFMFFLALIYSILFLYHRSVAFITKDSIWNPIGVIGVFAFVQYLEANVIFPKVVGKQLDLSTWATLVAIVAGGIIWGIAGMILFIPMVAILKIIAQNVPEWEPLYILLNRKEYKNK